MSKANNYDVVLKKVGSQQLRTIKILCETLELGLADAKAIVDKTPTAVATGLEGDKAIALKNELETIGNTVSIPGMETKTNVSAPLTKAVETDNTPEKKSVPSPLKITTPKNNDFDAIFGESISQQAVVSTKPKCTVKTKLKTASSKATAASNDEFDVIFGKPTP